MCCADKEGLFESAAVRTMVARTIEEAVDFGVDILDAYVVMPDHLHILLKLGHDKTLERTVNDLKK
ncbi:MAG: transposase, partial [Armatimonadia bacterium]